MTDVIVRDYAAHQFAIEAKSQGNVRIREVAQYTFTVPMPVPVGPVLPSWVTHYFNAKTLSTLADLDPVVSWTDDVAGLTVGQTTPSARPVYRTAGINGFPSVYADGVDDFLLSTVNVDFTAGLSVWVVAQVVSVANYRVIYEVSNGAGEQSSVLFSGAAGQVTMQERYGTVTSIATVGGTIAANVPYRAFGVQNNASSSLRVVDVNSDTTVTGPPALPAIAAPLRLLRGTGALAASGMRGYLACLIFGPPAVTPEMQAEMEAFILAEWGI